MRYTINFHVRRLIAMLKQDDLCNCCPKIGGFKEFADKKIILTARHFDYGFGPHAGNQTRVRKAVGACNVCRGFVGLNLRTCPCHAYGEAKARVLTEASLQRYYAHKEGRLMECAQCHGDPH